MRTVKTLKGITLGTIEVGYGYCSIRWNNGRIMFFRGPAVIVFKHGRDTLLVAFDGEKLTKKLIRKNWLPLVTADPKLVTC